MGSNAMKTVLASVIEKHRSSLGLKGPGWINSSVGYLVLVAHIISKCWLLATVTMLALASNHTLPAAHAFATIVIIIFLLLPFFSLLLAVDALIVAFARQFHRHEKRLQHVLRAHR